MRRLSLWCMLALAFGSAGLGCGGPAATEEPSDAHGTSGDETGVVAADDDGDGPPSMTADDCAARGGSVVGDIGDGAIHEPGYLCPDGQPPIASVPSGIEGAVCCGT